MPSRVPLKERRGQCFAEKIGGKLATFSFAYLIAKVCCHCAVFTCLSPRAGRVRGKEALSTRNMTLLQLSKSQNGMIKFSRQVAPYVWNNNTCLSKISHAAKRLRVKQKNRLKPYSQLPAKEGEKEI